ncbi:MAG TPA: polysaccharide deacetylase family protein [Solirubrobacterales bacterium]|nr:polysaccharide deacetylase family protein [Solirubrobacterales bacterium]
MSDSTWPNGARGALSLSFDNLGEAAEIELGAIPPDAPLGGHPTATRVLPAVLEALDARGIAATFFVEGLNTVAYPEQLAEIAASGHEVGYHAWRHEQWADLSAADQADNLTRGLDAFGGLGLELAGLRPPGGGLGPGEFGVLREAGLRYCSPSGEGVGTEDGVAVVPFQWRHVDASCVLPPLAPVRERMTGSPDPLDPAAFLAYLDTEMERVAADGGYAAIVLHLFMLEWLGEDRLAALLECAAQASSRGDLWVAPCAEVADHVLANPEHFRDQRTVLDPTSWTS